MNARSVWSVRGGAMSGLRYGRIGSETGTVLYWVRSGSEEARSRKFHITVSITDYYNEILSVLHC